MDQRLNGLRQFHHTHRKTNIIRLIARHTSLWIYRDVSPIQQIPILRSVEEILRREDDAGVCFCVERDWDVCDALARRSG